MSAPSIPDAVDEARLREILDGLDGVTPGPWHRGALFSPHHVFDGEGSEIARTSKSDFVKDGQKLANAAHIARCDPDTIRYLVTQELSRRSSSHAEPVASGQVVAWECYWPGAGSVDSVTRVVRSHNTMERMRAEGAEILPLGYIATPPAPAEPVGVKGLHSHWHKLSGDARLGRCDTEGCGGQPTFRLKVDGIGSKYCSGCAAKIQAIQSTLQPPAQPVPEASGKAEVVRYGYHVSGVMEPLEDGSWVRLSDHDATVSKLKGEVERLEGELREWRQGWEDDGRDARYFSKAMRAQQRACAAEARATTLENALKPFASYAWALRGRRDDEHELGWMGTNEAGEPDEVNLTVATFRQAYAALNPSPHQDSPLAGKVKP